MLIWDSAELDGQEILQNGSSFIPVQIVILLVTTALALSPKSSIYQENSPSTPRDASTEESKMKR